jgi:putative glutamine amidotransferase
MAFRRPVIGLTLDAEPPGGYSRWPWYALRANYASAIEAAGGLPLALPHLAALAEEMLARLDGLIVTGGAFDVDPAIYGEAAAHPSVTLKSARTEAEMALLAGALAADKPVLGICGGEQLLAVMLGGTLVQHIPDEIPNALPHEGHEPGHPITLVADTRLARATGAGTMHVNSSHHQAVRTPGREAIVNAYAPDGVIEGIEAPGRRFCLGVQWHPEFLTDPGDGRLLAAFVAACR